MKRCRICRQKTPDVNLWTETVWKYCWQKSGKTIYSYDLRNTTQYRQRRTCDKPLAEKKHEE